MDLEDDERAPMTLGSEDHRHKAEQRANLYVEARDIQDSPRNTCSWQMCCLIILLTLIVFLLGALVGENIPKVVTNSNLSPVDTDPKEGNSQSGHVRTSTKAPTKSPTKSSTKSAQLKVSDEQLTAMATASRKIIKDLEQYYGEYKNMLVDGWNLKSGASDRDEAKMVAQVDSAVVRKIAEALVDPEQKTFVVSAIGSSVAAGHDNCMFDSYESQMERLWSPAWEAAGMKLEVRNAGQGGGCGDTYKNQVWCLKQTAGQDSDIVHYTWTYFESPKDRYEYHEVFVRNALLLDKHPVPQIWNTGTGPCYGDSPLLKEYSKYGFNYLCLEQALSSGGKYGGRKWGQVGDQYHNTTRYGEDEDDESRRDSLGVVFRNWHPGPLGFQMVSDAFVYSYARATLDAVAQIKQLLSNGGNPVKSFSRQTWIRSDLPALQHCVKDFCPMDEPSECLNLEEPVFGYHGASLASTSDDLNPYASSSQKWTKFRYDKGPNEMVNKNEVRYMESHPDLKCEFADHCAGFHGSAGNGNLVFRLPKMTMGVLSVCFCCSKTTAMDFLENEYADFVDFEIDNSITLDKTKFFAANGFGEKCLTVMNGWPENMSNGAGHLYFAIKIRDDIPEDARAKFELKLDHIITL